MWEFFRSRAGKQLLLLSAFALGVWACGVALQANFFALLVNLVGGNAANILLALLIAGMVGSVYSVLRIYDLRKEMVIRRQAEHKADWIATHDHLTQLPNRYAFERVDATAFSGESDCNGVEISKPSVTVFSLDLDGFKKVNDLMGHGGGDQLLKQVARRLCQFAGSSEVFRFGGDEFIVLALNLDHKKEQQFAQLLIQSITRPIQIEEIWTEVGASVGYARWPDHGATLEQVSHKSDIALYEAKSTRRNGALLFTSEMQEKVAQRALLEDKLRKAIERKVIEPYYQPLIDLKTGDVCGFEALARWTDENGVPIPPQVFIGVAEETGLITALFQQLLSRSCLDAMMWPDDVVLSFNVSPVQMEDRLLVTRILDVLAEANLPSHRFEVEITENALIQDPDLAVEILDKFRHSGIQVALDDFGTGYSSLSQLTRYKFDKIKIDKSFVADLDKDESQKKILQAVLGLTRNLNLKTTVEGIEENAQLAYFLQQGCDIGQGYLFGKAMPAHETLNFIRQHQSVHVTGPQPASAVS
ncbi:putative bifunctional diguanylate cyclase/phosphodiesterase [Agrobacterium sp. ES01]|uniref:putative bifunctional diguanylate cyclase/phosphodiesterase n=1 Tax=Agrobacterium sp. ES01 TaxID=3420714 RepID=UPI003D144B45